ncbi:nuclear transport factor 2 family protein [Aeromicrobium sp. YIM 150415]|uniref:nuclear transport factor 2 family protein n=1 Tax=Aeromicrobium sp. YIM 150415 TaxID=2803912 RepID=UPI0019657C9A|nr:nuclear transport factor 2 family protein [Aeromicrobium sp. YIM 150415]MBM9465370.1 nuclear transport factor 2 family protein [Aeromicrobium sp. YIM 150415]
MRTRTTADIVARFHRAFADHDAGLLAGLIGEECVMEAISPVPDGARTEGRDACLAFWRALAEDRTTQFEAEEVDVSGERATIRWRYRFGTSPSESVRGVTLMRVVGGVIVEALGYSKTGEVPLAAETEGGRSEDHAAGTRTVREVLDRYNEAFEERDPGLLTDLIADDCVIEDSGPAPDGARHVGGAACRARWTGLIEDPSLTFAPDSPEIFGDLAIQPWTLRWGSAEDERLRGVNLLRIREGKIVEARGYVKS